jgi:hypothetical protein
MLSVKELRKSLPVIVLAGLVIWCMLYSRPEGYGLKQAAPLEGADAGPVLAQGAGCAVGKGVGLASSLLPREVSSAEDFGQFAPDEILKGQNFLDPRKQIGFPETIGGNIRNANQSIRAEPANPKQPYVWQNSTITPDLMRRPLD